MNKEPIKKTTLRLPDDLWLALAKKALDKRISHQKAIEIAIERYVKEPS